MWIKVCGMTTDEAVQAALDARVDAIGFVFAESKRQVTPQRAAELAAPARGRVRCVAVTRIPSRARWMRFSPCSSPDVLQSDWRRPAEPSTAARADVMPVLRAGGREPQPHCRARLLFEGPVSGTGIPDGLESRARSHAARN